LKNPEKETETAVKVDSPAAADPPAVAVGTPTREPEAATNATTAATNATTAATNSTSIAPAAKKRRRGTPRRNPYEGTSYGRIHEGMYRGRPLKFKYYNN